MSRYKSLMPLLGALAMLSASSFTHNINAADDHEDDFLYNKMATIEGDVWILNHPSLGKTLATNQGILFQRAGCKKCVIYIEADEKGHYKIRVHQGRYKVIVRDGSREGELKDMLAPAQARYVEAASPIGSTKFDINIVLPK